MRRQPPSRFHGSVKIYVTGELDASGGTVVNFYGSAVGRSVKVSGDNGDSAFHYDASLRTYGPTGIATLEQLFGREPSPPRR